jgi:hypothetical protein
MRALANKFGAHLTFRQGESSGTIDLEQYPQSKPAWPGTTAPIATLLDAARAMINFNRAYWRLLLRMYGWRQAA